MFFDIMYGENIFKSSSLFTFIGNSSRLDNLIILFILDLNSEFRNFKLWDQKLLFKGFVSCGLFLRDFET